MKKKYHFNENISQKRYHYSVFTLYESNCFVRMLTIMWNYITFWKIYYAFILFVQFLCVLIFYFIILFGFCTALFAYCLWHMKRNNYNVSKTVWPSGLRRVTWNHFSSGGVGSNPATVVFITKTTNKEEEEE